MSIEWTRSKLLRVFEDVAFNFDTWMPVANLGFLKRWFNVNLFWYSIEKISLVTFFLNFKYFLISTISSKVLAFEPSGIVGLLFFEANFFFGYITLSSIVFSLNNRWYLSASKSLTNLKMELLSICMIGLEHFGHIFVFSLSSNTSIITDMNCFLAS